MHLFLFTRVYPFCQMLVQFIVHLSFLSFCRNYITTTRYIVKSSRDFFVIWWRVCLDQAHHLFFFFSRTRCKLYILAACLSLLYWICRGLFLPRSSFPLAKRSHRQLIPSSVNRHCAEKMSSGETSSPDGEIRAAPCGGIFLLAIRSFKTFDCAFVDRNVACRAHLRVDHSQSSTELLASKKMTGYQQLKYCIC